MKALSVSLFAILSLAGIWSCKKKDADGAYYYGTWNIRMQQYTSPDTTYSSDIPAGVHTYTFRADRTVDVLSPGFTGYTDSWESAGRMPVDSIYFGNGQSWQVSDKNAHSFSAEFYLNSNVRYVFRLEK